MLAQIGAWILKVATGDVLGKIVDVLAKTEDGKAKLEEIRSRATEHLAEVAAGTDQRRIEALNSRAVAKLNMPVFWVIVAGMMGPPLLILWGVAVYNILWWKDGIWPQQWSIAEFPPAVKPWADAAVNWLFDPLGPPSGIGTSLLAAWLTKK